MERIIPINGSLPVGIRAVLQKQFGGDAILLVDGFPKRRVQRATVWIGFGGQKMLTISGEPLWAAKLSGVRPFLFSTFGFAPAARSC